MEAARLQAGVGGRAAAAGSFVHMSRVSVWILLEKGGETLDSGEGG